MTRQRLIQIGVLPFLAYVVICLTGCGGGDKNLVRGAYYGEINVVKAALQKGEDPNEIGDYGWTPLAWATYYEHYAIVRELLAHGANPNLPVQSDMFNIKRGSTPLTIAAYYGKTRLVRMLLKYGANPNIPNAEGETPLSYAERFGFRDIVAMMKRPRKHPWE